MSKRAFTIVVLFSCVAIIAILILYFVSPTKSPSTPQQAADAEPKQSPVTTKQSDQPTMESQGPDESRIETRHVNAKTALSEAQTEVDPTPPSTPGRIEGRVTLNGMPFPEVRVSVVDAEVRSVESDAMSNNAGEYTIENVPPGEHRIEANVGRRQIRLVAVVASNTTTTIDLAFDDPTASIAGRVTVKGDAPARFDVRGWVHVPSGEEHFAAIENSDGTYEIDGYLPSGEAKLVVAAWNVQGAYFRRETTIALEPDVVAITDFEFSVWGGLHGVATGLLPDGINGIAFYSVGTQVPKTLAEFTSDEFAESMGSVISFAYIGRDGTYQVDGLEPGEYEFAAISKLTGNEVEAFRKARLASGHVVIQENVSVELNLELEPLPES